MSTTLEINLSPDMQAWLSQDSGIYAFAILYGAATQADTAAYISSLTLVDDGVVASGGAFTMDLNDTSTGQLWSGKVYFIIQSTDDPSQVIDPATLDQSDINWGNAATLDYRYDSMEVSLTDTGGDAANLTSIEGFGIPMTLSASTGSRGYAVSGDTIFDDIAAAPTDNTSGLPPVTSFTGGGLVGENRLGVSPAVAVAPGSTYTVYQAADWNAYIAALQDAATPIVINGFFNGAPDQWAGGKVWRNAGFFSYELYWDADADSFWLTPTEGSQIQGAIKLTADQLAISVYSTLGTVELYDSPDDTTAIAIYPDGTTAMNVGANNAWGQVLQQLTLGLTAGYLQSTGASPNAAVTDAVDLNKNYNWSPIYAFGTDTTSSLPPGVTQRFDPYASIFFHDSNSYGTQYADALMNAFQQGGPQLPTWTNGANVPTLSLTLYADTETPPAGSYTPPALFDFVAGTGTGGQYEIPQFWQGNPANIVLNFNPGIALAQGLVLDDDVQITFRVLSGYSGSTPQWQSFTIDGGTVGPWQTWTFVETNGALTLTGNGVVGTPESLTLVGLPMLASGVAWYQIVVEQDDFAKTFNLYTTTFMPAGNAVPQFVNFANDPASFGIDGLASLAPAGAETTGGLVSFSVNVTGPTPTIDLALMQPNTSSSYLDNQDIMAAPVAGTLDGGDFSALGGQTEAPMAGADGVDLAVTADTGALVFGWTGLNGASTETADWIETFTNLVQGNSIALVDILAAGGGSIAPLQAVADITGAWQTPVAQQFGNGTYTVSMTAYAADASTPGTADLDTPLTRESATLTVTVAIADLDLAPTTDGQGIELEKVQDGPDGNWIRFTTTAGGLADGVAVLLYAVDELGRPVGPGGLPVGSIADAALGWVGTVGSDSGTMLLQGAQSVFLPVGLQLRFAIADDDGGLTPVTPDTITDQGDGTLLVDLDGLTLEAEVDNTLSPDEQAAAVQRMYGTPVVWLEEGDRFEVTVTGSARNFNTLGFVRVALDPETGEVGIPGIPGSGAGFRNGVRDRLDDGYRATVGGGTFSDVETWTLDGETGFYAPVLLTQRGLVFVGGLGAEDGFDYIRTFGANVFGFEDLTAAQGGDFDYNDLVMVLRPILDDV